jgi:hypothetical protein
VVLLAAVVVVVAATLLTVTMLFTIIMATEFIIHFGGPITVRISTTFLVVNTPPIADVTGRLETIKAY